MSQREEDKDCKVFVGGLHSDTTEDGLKDIFSQYGVIKDVIVMREKENEKKSRGFGFVTFTNRESVDDCIKGKPHIVDEKEVETKRAVPREYSTPSSSSSEKTRKVFLGGLPLETTKEELLAELSIFGAMLDAQIMTDKITEKPRGFGFAIFEDYDSADKLCAKKYFKIRDRNVEVKKAVPKEDMGRRSSPPRSGGGGGGYGYGGGRGGGGDGYGQRPYQPKISYRDYHVPAYDYRYAESDYMRSGYMGGGGGGYGMAGYPDTRTASPYQSYGGGYARYPGYSGGYDMSAYSSMYASAGSTAASGTSGASGSTAGAGGGGGAGMGTYSQSPSGYGPSRAVYGVAADTKDKDARGNGTRAFHPYKR